MTKKQNDASIARQQAEPKRDQAIATIEETARQRDELEANLRHQCKLNGKASMQIEDLEKQRDELLAAFRSVHKVLPTEPKLPLVWQIKELVETAIAIAEMRARCQPAEKGGE